MKKTIIFLSILMMLIAYIPVMAQDKNVTAGPMVGFATGIKAPALGIRGTYHFNEKIRTAPSLVYYLKSGLTVIDVNADAHYL